MIQLLFSISLFLSASLLFIIQPMVAKSLLPIYGGTPAVWTVCMLFFQALLLLAYGYAWALSYINHNWYWRLIHAGVLLLSVLWLPLYLTTSSANPVHSPDLIILKSLFMQLGLPLLVIASSAPLLQFAFSHTKSKKAPDPYFLYVASNIGSLLALLSYPWAVERWVDLSAQYQYWNDGFKLYLVLITSILFFVPYSYSKKIQAKRQSLSYYQLFTWISYSFIPCSLMLGVTFYISTDIAATPLFWVIPLALYLLSFIITFAQKPLIPHQWVVNNALLFAIFPLLAFILGVNSLSAYQLIIIHLAYFFIIALLCHGELVQRRPAAEHLTSFYVCLALGGVLAGLFNGLLAPRLFQGPYEYPLVVALSFLCFRLPLRGLNYTPLIIALLLLGSFFLPNLPWLNWVKKYHLAEFSSIIIMVIWARSCINLFVATVILFIFIFSPWFKHMPILAQQRNFYGIKQVSTIASGHALISQSTVHGIQVFSGQSTLLGTTSYYGPPALVIELLQQVPLLRSILIGLGTGTMVCQFRQSDQLEVIDIDEQVINIADNPRFFTYLRDCLAKPVITQGDGRLVLQQREKSSTDLLIIDAFSSDSIPTHLLTYEAFKLYKQKLTANGVLLVHISNRHINLLPVLTAIGRKLDWVVLHQYHTGNSKLGQFSSEWVVLTPNEPFAIELLRKNAGWKFVTTQKTMLWTDNYSNLIPLLKY
ncbi:spermidine synthase [Legionella beliardensis]|uniref:Spermidine synthase n=1 Tax=Legionella beliardensis TaxID=91822 RepID=A0A378I3E7_9GAMM|nr:fused MFS/spermidine synthase [Legionella beliardensis]STX29523.1 spermidine synthase [Legionella beliardensis]